MNLPISTFEPLVQSVANSGEFAASAKHSVQIVCISSISAVQNWHIQKEGAVPELSLSDTSPCDSGYGESKLAASTVLEEVAGDSGMPISKVRFGLVAGPTSADISSMWSQHHWVPTTIGTSASLKT